MFSTPWFAGLVLFAKACWSKIPCLVQENSKDLNFVPLGSARLGNARIPESLIYSNSFRRSFGDLTLLEVGVGLVFVVGRVSGGAAYVATIPRGMICRTRRCCKSLLGCSFAAHACSIQPNSCPQGSGRFRRAKQQGKHGHVACEVMLVLRNSLWTCLLGMSFLESFVGHTSGSATFLIQLLAEKASWFVLVLERCAGLVWGVAFLQNSTLRDDSLDWASLRKSQLGSSFLRNMLGSLFRNVCWINFGWGRCLDNLHYGMFCFTCPFGKGLLDLCKMGTCFRNTIPFRMIHWTRPAWKGLQELSRMERVVFDKPLWHDSLDSFLFAHVCWAILKKDLTNIVLQKK